MNTLSIERNLERRLFFALWPDEAIRDMLAGIARSAACEGRSVAARNFHVTLAFLGQVDTNRQDCVERVAMGIVARPFVLRLDRLGCFRRAGIVWSGISETPAELAFLVGELQRGLARCEFVPEERPFKAHVTLFRKVARALENIPHDPVEWPVGDFCLAESSTLPTGARYRVLRRWPLRG
uniref:RNA 2',3'-cyclic phosphodiesterase n=1 Tax=Candidatus Kentrum sp. LFY TaxID=2126342 RepID=A0A450WR75_9GAMM|nr:MAG: 2'-5' RNA ligase [Candidatus Kentron sp. LFY]VFK19535.1 MAG: 2'-5' RNA ligase [Candidatus Kentron sp. LFY]